MSAPAANAFSDPVITIAPTSGLASKSSNWAPISATNCPFSAFSAAGRCKRIKTNGTMRFDKDQFRHNAASPINVLSRNVCRRVMKADF